MPENLDTSAESIRKTHAAQEWAIEADKTRTKMTEADIPDEYKRHAVVFSETASQRYPLSREWDHVIELTPDAPATMDCKVYPLSRDEHAELRKFLDDQLTKGYIRSSKSPYASPFFFIKKKNNKLRPVQDYRELNKYTVRNTYPLPLIKTLTENLKGCHLYTKFDIRWGYNNIRIKEGDEWKAAFKTEEGLFEPTVMFFGLTNSPSTFQAMMNSIFRSQLSEVARRHVFVYMDDILIATPDDLAVHRPIVHEVLDVLEKESLFLHPEKCVFETKCVEYLGLILEGDSIGVDPAKVDGLKSWPCVLKNVKEVRSTLGVFGYQRPFIKGFANIACPLTNLLKKDQPFVWTPDCTAAINKLVDILTSAPVLQQPDLDKPFEMEVDASAFATGGILYQRDKNNKLQPVAYYSKTFNAAERNYDIHDRELMAVVNALKEWRHFLICSPHVVTIYTDHANLQYYKHPQKINRRVARYIPLLGDYNIKLVHKPGATNRADALSRHPDHDDGSDDNKDVVVLPPQLFARAAHVSSLDDQIRAAQSSHSSTLQSWEGRYSLIQHDGLWWQGDRLVVVEDHTLRRGVISLSHDTSTAGHPGIANTLALIARDYFWPGMRNTVVSYVKGCAACQMNKVVTNRPRPPLFPITVEPSALPFEMITLDFITKLPISRGYDSILTITDHDCTKATIFLPCHETIDGPGVAALYHRHVFPHFGLPRHVISDRDPCFASFFTCQLCSSLGITQNISTTYHPQTDGQSERSNQWLEQYLHFFCNGRGTDWVDWLPSAQFTHNTWPSATTKQTPFDLLMGYTPRAPARDISLSSAPSVNEQLMKIQDLRML